MLGIRTGSCFCEGVAVDVLVRDVRSDSSSGRGVAGQWIISGTRSMPPSIGKDVTTDPVDLTVTLFPAEIPRFDESQELYNVTQTTVIQHYYHHRYQNIECAPTLSSTLSERKPH